MSRNASAATTRRGIEFDRTLDAVDDLGLDPNGNEPVQHKLQNADLDGALVVFPDGEYLVTDRVTLTYINTVGMLGKGDARFVVPENYNTAAVLIDRGQRVLFENIDLDLRADGATPGYKFGAHDTAEIHDVELIGQGVHPDSDPRGEGSGNPRVQMALHLAARKPDANVVVENFVARNQGQMGSYNHGNGRLGVWVGRATEGTVTLRNCHLSGFPNNGLYTSRTHGTVQVEGGIYRNNDVSQVRLGSKGSYVEGALLEVDPAKSDSPNIEDMLNGRGVRISSGPVKTGGVTVRNCDVHIADDANSEGGVIVARSGGKFDVVDTRIRVDTDSWALGVRVKRPNSGGSYAPPTPYNGRLKNVSVTGSSKRAAGIKIIGRPDSVVDSCCVEHDSHRRDGVHLVDSDGTVVKNSTLNVGGEELRLDNTNADASGNTTSGSCPTPASEPQISSGTEDPDDGGSIDDGESSNDGGDDSSSTGEPTKQFTIETLGDGWLNYSVEVSGELTETWASEEGELTSSTTISDGKVQGKWDDRFKYTGEIKRLVVEGDATFVYDESNNQMEFTDNDTGRVLSYEVTVDGDGKTIWRTNASTEEDAPDKSGDGVSVQGRVGGAKDAYGTNGGFRSIEFEDVFSFVVEDL